MINSAADFFGYSPTHESEGGSYNMDDDDDDNSNDDGTGGGLGDGLDDLEDDDDDVDMDSDSDGELQQGKSGGGAGKYQFTEIREQMYQDRLEQLKRKLRQLNDGTLPEYVKRLRRLEAANRERMRISEVIKDLELEMTEQDYINEKRCSVREFEEQKVFMRDQLVSELEEKQRMIEAERHNMELTNDSMELKPISTRKLRKRPNESNPGGGGGGGGGYGGDKRGSGVVRGANSKPANVASLSYLLTDTEVNSDLKEVNKNRAYSAQKASSNYSGQAGSTGTAAGSSTTTATSAAPQPSSSSSQSSPSLAKDTRIEEGKLFYEKRWFRRGQTIQVENKTGDKFSAMISAIGSEAMWVRKLDDNSKVRIYVSQLSKGKFTLKRRAV